MNNMLERAALLGLVLAFAAAGCSKYEPAEPSAEAQQPAAADPAPAAPGAPPPYIDETVMTLEPGVELPAGWQQENITSGDCITPVDQIDGAAISTAGYTAGSPATFVGWNVTSSKTDATPALIHGVLKPYEAGKHGALLSGKRVPRPDVAGDNRLYDNAGYELSGNMPAEPGRYRFYVWTGTPEAIVECDSKVVVTIH